MVDGFDNQASAFAAPALMAQWHVARAVLGPVFAASAFGTLAGSLLIGPLGDLLGRKTLIVLSLVLAAALMALTGSVHTLPQLIAVRFLTGLPLGALIPGTIVIANEWSPAKSRAAMVTIMACGFALGAVLGGLLSSVLLPRYGWPSVFHAGAAATTLIAAAVLLWLPESLRYLALRPNTRNDARAGAILQRFRPATGPLAAEPQPKDANLVLDLFADGRAPVTLLLWIAFFMNLLVLNFMTFWLPTLLGMTGLSPAVAIRMSTLFQFGGIAGVVLMGSFARSLGAWRLVLGGSLLAALAVALVGLLKGGATIAAAGFFVIGVQMTLSALAATLYPTAIRATGTSWAQGIGRIGSTLGPLAGTVLLGWHWPLSQLFAAMAVFPLLGLAATFVLTRRLPREAA
jgi:AAHS family 4-hydroxybenzoate transporter-like MFS transporter